MATSPRYSSKLLPSLFLVLLAFSHAAREPASTGHHREADGRAAGEEAVSFSMEADERCAGEGNEECMMRRTLVAHTDYIYTQGGNHN